MRVRSTKNALVALLSVFVLFGATTGDAVAGKLNLPLQLKLAESPGVAVTALVFLTADAEEVASLSSSIISIKDFSDRYKIAYRKLRSASDKAQDSFDSEVHGSALELEIGRRFWIANAVEVTATPADLERLAEFASVEIIVEDAQLELVAPVEVLSSPTSQTGAEPNLVAINADELWAMGITGEGRLVMSFDTGVDGSHPGLASRWRGLTSGNPSEGWYDPFEQDFPSDAKGHGTHVMGLMAGLFNGDTVGVAPDAEWACAAVVDRGVGFSQTITDILAAFEWAANPDGDPETTHDIPDAICHSWGVPRGVFGPCDNTFWQAIDNLEQLGIVNIFACGNEGPDSATIRNPADRASSPLNSFSVGAVDHREPDFPVADFSSRGPANCDSTQIKPEIVAPGVAIRSLYPGETMKLISGTSMASPQVAGAVALLRQYNPDATVEQIKHALLMSARDIGEPGEDNASGHGLIDLQAALAYMPMPEHAVISYRGFGVMDGGNGIIEPDEEVQLTVDIEIINYDVSGLWAVLSTYDNAVTILSDSAYYGTFSAGIASGNETQPFEIRADRLVTPGAVVTFRIDFFDMAGEFLNNAYFDVVVAQSQDAASGSINNGLTSVGSCNYGVVGLGAGSMVDLGQAGFSVDSVSFLAEFALVVSDSDGRVSDAARDLTGDVSDNDFMAETGASFAINPNDSWGDLELVGKYTDSLAEDPIGIIVEQRVSLFYEYDLSAVAFVQYSIRNIDSLISKTLSIGLVADIDFSESDTGVEMIGFDPSRSLAYYYDTELSSYIGTGILSGQAYSFGYVPNPFHAKIGLSDTTKENVMTSGIISTPPSKRGDYAHIMALAPQVLSGSRSLELVTAIIWAESESELLQKYDYAYNKYNAPTDSEEDDDAILPHAFSLSQNYPNPFNPQTTIRFSIDRGQQVSLSVYNLLGQNVKTLVDRSLKAGNHEVVWDGLDDFGNSVASGVYFYRLDTSSGHVTRKMMLLK